MKTIYQKYEIKASVDKVWQALTNKKDIEKWGAGSCKMDENVGTKFELWDGDIFGTNIEVEKFKKLVQEWYSGKWKEPSIVTFKLEKNGHSTQIELVQENIPDEEYEDINQGWKDYYLGKMKEYLEGK